MSSLLALLAAVQRSPTPERAVDVLRSGLATLPANERAALSPLLLGLYRPKRMQPAELATKLATALAWLPIPFSKIAAFPARPGPQITLVATSLSTLLAPLPQKMSSRHYRSPCRCPLRHRTWSGVVDPTTRSRAHVADACR